MVIPDLDAVFAERDAFEMSRSDLDLDSDGREEEYRADEDLGRDWERFCVEDLREEARRSVLER